MSSKRLSLTKILKFATENGFQPFRIFRIRSSVRYILLSHDSGGEILAVEIPTQYSALDKSKNAKFLKASETNQKHLGYWSLMSSKLTDYDLLCCGSEDLTIFKHDGETKGYKIVDYDHNEEEEEAEKESLQSETLDIERRTQNLLKETELDRLKEYKKKHPILKRTKIVFQDNDGKQLTDEDLRKESVTVIPFQEAEDEDEDETQKPSSFRLKLDEIVDLDEENELELGEFYLVEGVAEFYKDIDSLKRKLATFYSCMKEEENSIRQNRIENITFTLASLHETIKDAFKWYTDKEQDLRNKLDRFVELYKKILPLTKTKLSDDKKLEINKTKEELKQNIKQYKQDLFTIRDTTNTLLGRLEGDIEKISLRCSLPEVGEEY